MPRGFITPRLRRLRWHAGKVEKDRFNADLAYK